MKTIEDFLWAIREDTELTVLIQKSADISRSYTPRKQRSGARRQRTASGIALDRFWESLEGAQFRARFETRFGVNLADNQARSGIKIALHMYISEFRRTLLVNQIEEG
ncbi:MAG: hypothetical protein ACYCYO_02095 [Bacilli bacterium]